MVARRAVNGSLRDEVVGRKERKASALILRCSQFTSALGINFAWARVLRLPLSAFGPACRYVQGWSRFLVRARARQSLDGLLPAARR